MLFGDCTSLFYIGYFGDKFYFDIQVILKS
jgi:hypothetical protein